MSQVTLIGDRIAEPGSSFVFQGPQPACRECKLKSVCLQLDRGRLYQILKARDIHHEDDCHYHENGVRVVEVELAVVLASLRTKLAIEGSTVEHVIPVCSNHECENFELCHPGGLGGPTRVKVAKTSKALSCPLGYDLTAVELEYV